MKCILASNASTGLGAGLTGIHTRPLLATGSGALASQIITGTALWAKLWEHLAIWLTGTVRRNIGVSAWYCRRLGPNTRTHHAYPRTTRMYATRVCTHHAYVRTTRMCHCNTRATGAEQGRWYHGAGAALPWSSVFLTHFNATQSN